MKSICHLSKQATEGTTDTSHGGSLKGGDDRDVHGGVLPSHPVGNQDVSWAVALGTITVQRTPFLPEEDIIKTLDHRSYMYIVEDNISVIMNEGSPGKQPTGRDKRVLRSQRVSNSGSSLIRRVSLKKT